MIDTTNIKKISIAEYLIGRGWKLTAQRGQRSKVSHYGACPICQEGTDRFQVFRNNGFYCRRCECGGDIINLVQLIDGVDFAEACRTLGQPNPSPFQPLPQQKQESELSKTQWQYTAEAYWTACHSNAIESTESKPIEWLLNTRRIKWKTIEQFGVGVAQRWFKRGSFSAPSGIVLPYLNSLNRPVAINTYLDSNAYQLLPLKRKMVKGSDPTASFFGQHLSYQHHKVAIICEGELDTMVLHGLLPDRKMVALGVNGDKTKPSTQPLWFISRWFLISDSDEAGNNMYKTWKQEIPSIKRIELPKGHDVTSFVQNGGNLKNVLTNHCIKQRSIFDAPIARRGKGAYH